MYKLKILTFAWLSCVFYFGAIAQDPKKDITLLRPGPYNLFIKQHSDSFRIPVRLPVGIKIDQFHVYPWDCNPDITSLTAGLQSDKLNNLFLTITVEDGSTLKPGSYNIILNVEHKTINDSVYKQAIKFDIEVKPAVITATLLVNVVRVKSFPWCDFKAKGSQLSVYETSGTSYLDSFVIRANGALADAGGISAAGCVTFTGQDKGVHPINQSAIGYSFVGDYPLGKVSGSFDIISPRLTANVPFRMEVISKLGGLYLFAIILLGLICGYFLRTYLDSIIKLDTERLKAIELLKRILMEQAKRPDEIFRKRTKFLYDSVNDAVNLKKDMDETSNIITTVEPELTAAITEFNTRSDTLKANLEALKNLLNTNWILPEAYNDIISSAKNLVSSTEKLYQEGNVTEASSDLDDAENLFLKNCKWTTIFYRNQLSADLSAIMGARWVLPDLDTLVSDLKNTAFGIPVSDINVTAKTLLDAVHNANFKSGELVATTLQMIEAITNQILDTLRDNGVSLPDSAGVDALENIVKEIKNKQKEITGNDDAINKLAGEMTTIYIALKTAILNQVNSINTDPVIEAENVKARQAVIDSIASGTYSNAAELAVIFLKTNNFVARAAAKRIAAARQAFSLDKPPAGKVALVTPADSIREKVIKTEQIGGISKQTFRNLLFSKALQTGISGIGIIAVGFMIFGTNFIGTPADFASGFFWAFSLDISLATLVTQGGKLVKT